MITCVRNFILVAVTPAALPLILSITQAVAAAPFTTVGSLSAVRCNHTATLLPNGKVLVAGGYDGANILSGVELYDPASGAWTTADSLNSARYHSVAAASGMDFLSPDFQSIDLTL